MKKILALLLAAMMVFALAACGEDEGTGKPSGNGGSTPGTTQGSESTPGTSPSGDDNSTQPGDLYKIPSPEVTISRSGLASFRTSYAQGYRIKINGTEVASQTDKQTEYQLADGDTIQVMAMGDGVYYADSDWSSEATYHAPAYDFSNLGLSDGSFNNLIAYTEMEPGIYNEGTSILCENGDFIHIKKSGSTWEYIYDVDAYQIYTLIYDYTGKDNITSDYSIVNYTADHKYDFYQELSYYSFSLAFIWEKDANSKVYADYNAYLSDKGYMLLDVDTVRPATGEYYSHFELLDYTEYSQDIDYSLFNTTYLHPSRGEAGMYDTFKDKIVSWKIERSNYYNYDKSSWLYTDFKLTLTFDETFTAEDAVNLAAMLGSYGCVPDEGYPIVYDGYYGYEGSLAVYDYPYEDRHFDKIYDHYQILYTAPIGDYFFTPTLCVTYHNYSFDDANISYYILRDGLHKYVSIGDGRYYDILMLPATGGQTEHPLPPDKSLGNFSAQMHYSYSSDEPGAWHDIYTFQRVGDVFVTVRETEYSYEYTVIKQIGDQCYKRSGYLNKPSEWEPDPQIQWYDVEEAYDFFDSEFLDNISKFYRDYPRPVAGSAVTVAGKDCVEYTYAYDETTYTYAVYDGHLTLKFQESRDGYTTTVEFIKYETVNAFSADVQSIIDASGIADYTP